MASLRDYSLTGESSRLAQTAGLASATWYRTDIPRKTMKDLMRRRDGPAIRDTLIWFSSLALFAAFGFLTWETLWAVPCFAIYGLMYGAASDSRWHECSHGTAFKTRWMNEVIYQLASFMIIREPKVWKWSHARHHTDTIIVGRDNEIMATRPVRFLRHILALVGIPQTWNSLKGVLRHAMGHLSADEKDFIPEMEQSSVIKIARIWLFIHVAILVSAVLLESWYLVMIVGPFPAMMGVWLSYVFGLTQHAGLAENVLDHRQNCRTIYMNPVSRFIYWNMNYHLEHHMFPMVPYHALPKLHELMKHDCPPVYSSTWAAFKEVLIAMWRQSKDPEYFVDRPLPSAQQPTLDNAEQFKTA